MGDLKALAWVIVICLGYVAFEMNMHYFGGYNYLYFNGFGGNDNNGAALGFVIALGVSFFLFLNTTSLVQKGIVCFLMAMILHAILFSFSRGAMLSTGIGMTVSFFLIKKSPSHYLLFAAAVLAGVVLAGPQVRERFLDTFSDGRGRYEASAQSRLDMWADCWIVFKENLFLGCGPNHWPIRAKEFGWTNVLEAHSLWIKTATETGLPGILMLAGFYLAAIWRCWMMLIRIPDRAPPWFADGCRLTIASLCSFGVAAQFLSLELLEAPYYVALFGAATLSVYGKMELEFASEPESIEDWRDEPVMVSELYGMRELQIMN